MSQDEIRRLVVDTDVAYSASESDVPASRRCRAIIQRLLATDSPLRAVMSETLRDEWNDRSNPKKIWCVRWLAALESAGRVILLADAEIKDDDLREIATRYDHKFNITNPDRQAQKDVHLVEAAQATDQIIISKDRRARRQFSEISDEIQRLRALIWVNPEAEADCIDWLNNGAPPERPRTLGYRPNGEGGGLV